MQKQTNPPIPTQIIGHRGASFDAPENTLAAFKLAFEKGADGVELDVFKTADDHVIVSHDETTKRTGGVNYTIATTPLKTLKTVDVGKWKDEKYTGETMPTLPEVLAIIPPGKTVYIEIKEGRAIVPFIKTDIENSKLKPEQIRIISFDPAAVQEAKKLMPHIKAYLLFSFEDHWQEAHGKVTLDRILDELNETGADGVDLNDAPQVTPVFVNAIKNAGYEYHVWTINKPEVARKFRDLGVGSITTDRPAYIRDAIHPQANQPPATSASKPVLPADSP